MTSENDLADAKSEGFLQASTLCIRWLLGIQCMLHGINWWIKILPFPNMFDPPGLPVKAEIVRVMLDSGWMFGAAKCIELALGLALITNRFVALMLVVAVPVTFMTFITDALIWKDIVAWATGHASNAHIFAKLLDAIYFGGAVLVMQAFLMFAYFDQYRPMLAWRANPRFAA
ncbi:hypothetical protein CAF53_18630 [Sphingobium sp. LB126]|uniref:hypothetical protein n=1 Tax=Sphingobium sp. LB126 TaxID=1983755 RepID=UPI000C20BABF|nr:hypothetical protein [Sphingobium sp. LB126]PJG46221.1 hypothetical protein CAF53_18630 [Sphingobium sp. LB126]